MNKKIEVIKPFGIIDGINGNKVRQQAIELASNNANIILIDCQDITFMNSAGIGALVAALKSIRNAGGELYICSLNNQVEIIFKMTKMYRIFRIFNNREECYEVIKKTLNYKNS